MVHNCMIHGPGPLYLQTIRSTTSSNTNIYMTNDKVDYRLGCIASRIWEFTYMCIKIYVKLKEVISQDLFRSAAYSHVTYTASIDLFTVNWANWSTRFTINYLLSCLAVKGSAFYVNPSASVRCGSIFRAMELNAYQIVWLLSVKLLNIVLGNDLLPSGNKQIPGPKSTQIHVAIWRHWATISTVQIAYLINDANIDS